MELRVLRYFLAVAREESISGAAQALHLTQPTLSRQLMELEEEVGKKLFLRGSRRVTLTDDGVLLRKRASEILALVDKTESELRETADIEDGDIYIGGGETEGMRCLAQAIRAFHRRYPLVRFHLYSGNADDVSERVEKGLLDLGLLIDPHDTRKYGSLRLPVRDRWGLLTRKDSPLAGKEAIGPEDLRDQPLLLSQQSMVREDLSAWLGYEAEALRVVATYNLIYNASLLVETGVGHALCLEHLANTGEDSPLCFRPLSPPLVSGMSLIWSKYQIHSRATEAFLDLLRERLASAGPLGTEQTKSIS